MTSLIKIIIKIILIYINNVINDDIDYKYIDIILIERDL